MLRAAAGGFLEFEAAVKVFEGLEYFVREDLSEDYLGEFFIVAKLKAPLLEEPDAVSGLDEVAYDAVAVVEVGVEFLLREANPTEVVAAREPFAELIVGLVESVFEFLLVQVDDVVATIESGRGLKHRHGFPHGFFKDPDGAFDLFHHLIVVLLQIASFKVGLHKYVNVLFADSVVVLSRHLRSRYLPGNLRVAIGRPGKQLNSLEQQEVGCA